ncbi:MAG TPA: sodium:solute symporter [Opitutaceae bacterium]|nr:sodium:solute symporter [Opitutaceae bacterium]
MSHSLSFLDLAVLLAYLVGVTGFGCWFYWRNRESERYMSAGRSLPGWAVGLSIFGSYVSSISFLANPGKSYAGNWNAFVFAITLPVAAWVAVRWFVPFFRQSGDISAYHHLEKRFGAWARTYAVACYMLTQVARLGTIIYLLALALVPLTGWDIRTIILVTGAAIVVYPLFGGTEAVIWTGVVQAVVLVGGALACVVTLLIKMPGGATEIFRVAAEHDKFSLGSFGASLAAPTFWVVFVYGLVINLQNFGIDQSYVQRYVTARSDDAARRSVWLGALLYLPVGAAFFFIGTALFVFFQAQPGLLPAGIVPDAVFPHFISTQLPSGLAGLVIAALCAAAMDSNLNCMSTLFLNDVYRRYLRPNASEKESMRVLYLSTLVFGAICVGAAIAMIRIKSALDVWWELAGIFGGGMLGLFLLGRLVRRAGTGAGLAGVTAGIVVILWMTLSPKLGGFPAEWRSPFHGFLVIVFGTITVLGVGALTAWLTPSPSREPQPSPVL